MFESVDKIFPRVTIAFVERYTAFAAGKSTSAETDQLFAIDTRQYEYYLAELERARQTFIQYYSSKSPEPEVALTNVYQNEDTKKGILVQFLKKTGKDIDKDSARFFIENMNNLKVTIGILIAERKPNSDVQNLFNTLNYDITTFCYDELYIPVVDHCLVPKHERMTPSEVETLCQQMKTQPTSFPKMTTKDPVSKYYGYKRGNVIRIRRTISQYNAQNPNTITYRYVEDPTGV
jgi:DNA-directed RNA polymerase I, II, and III subunit RPABC1